MTFHSIGNNLSYFKIVFLKKEEMFYDINKPLILKNFLTNKILFLQ
jgi:hypothetical protein